MRSFLQHIFLLNRQTSLQKTAVQTKYFCLINIYKKNNHLKVFKIPTELVRAWSNVVSFQSSRHKMIYAHTDRPENMFS